MILHDDGSARRQTFSVSADNWTVIGRPSFPNLNASGLASYALDQINKHEPYYSDGVTIGSSNDLLDIEAILDGSGLEAGNFMPDNDSESDNSTSSDNFSSPYLMPWPQRTSWIAIFTLLVVVAAVGNALVAWIVFAHKRMKTVTNYFLVNLSLADLTMTLFNCIFNFTFMLNSHWPFGGFYCTVNNFVANVTVAASVFTLVAISFDRYIAIVYPLRPRMSKSTAWITISVIWFASCILAIPCLLYSQTISHSYPDGEIRVVCIFVWPDGVPSVSQQDFIYNIVFMVSTYLIPVIVMGACYSRMSYVLWRSKSIGEMNQRQTESIQSKRKVVRMFMVVVTLFVVCWLPYHGYFVYQFIDDQVISYKHVQHIFLSFYWLAMSNTMINPLVYYYMNTRFREHFRTVLCCCLCCRDRSSNSATMTAIGGTAIIITRASQRTGPIGLLRNDRAEFVTGPRPSTLSQRARQQPGNPANRIAVPAEAAAHLAADDSFLVGTHADNVGRQRTCVNLDKSVPDSSAQPAVVVSTDGANNGTSTWISSHGHLVTVWTPSSPQSRTNSIRSMNRINGRHIDRSSTEGCVTTVFKDRRSIAETKT